MRKNSQRSHRQPITRRSHASRLRVEHLEDRLPPGDWVLSQLVGITLFGSAPAVSLLSDRALPGQSSERETTLAAGSTPAPAFVGLDLQRAKNVPVVASPAVPVATTAPAAWLDQALATGAEQRARLTSPNSNLTTPSSLATVSGLATSAVNADLSAAAFAPVSNAGAGLTQGVLERMTGLGVSAPTDLASPAANSTVHSAQPEQKPTQPDPSVCDYGPDIKLPEGAQPVVWHGSSMCAVANEVLAGFSGIAGAGRDQVAAIEARVQAAGFNPVDTRYLGQDGAFRFRFSPEMSYEQVENTLRTVEGLRYVEPNGIVTLQRTPNDPRYGELYGMNNTGQSGGTPDADIDAPEAWDVAIGNTRTVIGLVDSGVDYDHPDLYRNIYINQSEIPASRMQNLTDTDGDGFISFRDLNDPVNQGPFKITDLNADGKISGTDVLRPMDMSGGTDLGTGGWRNNVSERGDTEHPDDILGWAIGRSPGWDIRDTFGHGTHCFGTIGAVGDNNVGVVGVNWNVLVYNINVFPDGGASWENTVLAINYLTDIKLRWNQPLKMSSNSWGGQPGAPPYPPAVQALQDAVERNGTEGNMLFVAAAGNGGQNINNGSFVPAGFNLPNIISVAATDRRDAKASFSNWGLDRVHLGAPGVEILSTMPPSCSLCPPGGMYGLLDGTSMATPHVAGAAALAWSMSPGATWQQIKDNILQSVDPNQALRREGPTPVSTGGRLNVQRLLSRMGFQVLSTTPADGEVITNQATDFVVNFTHAYDPATVAASDLTVNTIPATSVAQTTPTQLTFTFASSPITQQGLQNMAIAQDAIEADPGSGLPERGLRAFTSSFRYAAQRLVVESTTPAVGSVAGVPLAAMQVRFNLPVDDASVQAGDLRLNQGSASAVTMIDSQTYEFTLTGVTREGTLSATIAAGAVTDQFGNPMLAFAGNYILDIEAVELPALLPQPALGSLVYAGTTTGILDPANDADVFYYTASPLQTLSHIITPAAGLQPRAELYTFINDDVVLLGSASAGAPGQEAILGPVGTPGEETLFYALVVTGVAGTGNYTVQTLLNAGAEGEQHGGPSNNTLQTAQSLATAFQALPGGSRAGVLGRTDFSAGLLPDEFEPNNTQQTANLAAANFLPENANLYHMGIEAQLQQNGDLDYYTIGQLNAGDVITISLSGTPSNRGTVGDTFVELYRGPAGAPVLVTSNDDGGPGLDSLIYRFTVTQADTYYINARAFANSYSGQYDLGIWLQDTGAPPLTGGTRTGETEPNNSAATANDASDSWRRVTWLSRTTGQVTPAADVDFFEYRFTAGDLVTFDLRAGAGTTDLRATLYNQAGTIIAQETGDSDGPNRDSALYSFLIPSTGAYFFRVSGTATGGYTSDVYLATTTPPPEPNTVWDYYSVTLNQDQSATIGVKGLADPFVRLELVDGDDNVLAVGNTTANLDSVIGDFYAPATGTYYVRVTGRPFRDYNLVVTRGIEFDSESNDQTAQPILSSYGPDGLQWVLGHAGTGNPADVDRYSISVEAGQTLFMLSITPGSWGGLPGNTFDPILRVFAPGGGEVASDDNSLEGRNALLSHTAATSGQYVIEVATSPLVATRGEYMMGVIVFSEDGFRGGSTGGQPLDPLALSAGRTVPAVPWAPAADLGLLPDGFVRPELAAVSAGQVSDDLFAALAARDTTETDGVFDLLFPGWEG